MMQATEISADIQVAEYVFGLLSPDQSAGIERRIRNEAELREIYNFWLENLDVMNASYAPLACNTQYSDISRRIFGEQAKRPVHIWLKIGISVAVLIVVVVKFKILLALLG